MSFPIDQFDEYADPRVFGINNPRFPRLYRVAKYVVGTGLTAGAYFLASFSFVGGILVAYKTFGR